MHMYKYAYINSVILIADYYLWHHTVSTTVMHTHKAHVKHVMHINMHHITLFNMHKCRHELAL